MNYEYYKTFYFVGKYKTFSKAASAMYTSQPAVTRTIQKLESELGCQLFERGKSGVKFTHEGELLYNYVSIAYSHLKRGEDEVSKASRVESGIIYIGATVTALQEFLLRFLERFHLDHPDIKFKISTGSTNETIEKLQNGAVDLAFVSTPCSKAKSLTQTAVFQFQDILIAGNDYESLKDRLLPIEEIPNYPFVCLRAGMQLREFIDSFFEEHGISVTPDIELDSADLIVPMVGHNFGIGFAPYGLAQEALKRGDVFRVNLTQELPARQVCMISEPRHLCTRASLELASTIMDTTRIAL